MRFRYHSSVPILIAALTLLAACASRTGELTGEVFIVTKGGPSIRLALVEVTAVPEDSMRQFLASKVKESHQQKEKMQPQYDVLNNKEARRQRMKEEDKIELNFFVWQARYEGGNRSDKAITELAKARVEMEKVKARRESDDSFVKLYQHFNSCDHFLSGLPSPTVTAKTDADGRFTMVLPRTQRIALVARSQRQVGDQVEHYSWLLWTSLDGQKSKHIMLSNDNLMNENDAQATFEIKA